MTVSVTGFTAARSQDIEDNAVVSGSIVGDNLILTKHNGTTVTAGNVRGPVGPSGSIQTVANQAARLAISSPFDGQTVVELDTDRMWSWTGTAWRWVIGTGTSPYLVEATHTAGTAVTGGATITPVWVESTDRAGTFAAPTFTAPFAATWAIGGALRVTAAAGGTWNPAIDLVKNGAALARIGEQFFTAISGGSFSFPLSYDAVLAAGDTLRMDYLSGGVGSTIQTNHFSTRLTIDLKRY